MRGLRGDVADGLRSGEVEVGKVEGGGRNIETFTSCHSAKSRHSGVGNQDI